LTNLVLSDCISLQKLNFPNNQFVNLDFLNNLNEKKITFLDIRDNNITSDLTLFSRFTNSEILKLGDNNLAGSLKHLQGLNKLKVLNIENTNINNDLEYLPDSVKYFSSSVSSSVK